MTPDSHRERAKARRRAAVERAAWRLFAERGYEATTIPDIAELAEVAPRTVTLYFPSKADLVLSHVREATGRLVTALAERPATVATLDVLRGWLAGEFACVDVETAAALSAVFAMNPALRGLWTVEIGAAVAQGHQALAEELDLPPDALLVEVLTGAIVGALTAAVDARAAGHPPDEVVETTLRVVRTIVRSGGTRRTTAPGTAAGRRSTGAARRRPSSGRS